MATFQMDEPLIEEKPIPDMDEIDALSTEKKRHQIAEEINGQLRRRASSIMESFEEAGVALTEEDLNILIGQLKGDDLDKVWTRLKKDKDKSTEESSFKAMNVEPVNFSWQNLFFRYEPDGLVYLSGVSGYVNPGEMLLLLGAPDCQMDTLLRVLAKRDMQGEVFGTMLVDGEVPGPDFKQKISYVPKYEVHLPTITVQETLLTSYRLRMEESTENPAIFIRMLLILKVFGLLRVRENKVGDKKIRGISGGERRRLSFCTEVGGFASVLIADLPTNGLDSATAMNLCKTIRNVNDAMGFSCIFCLAQPSPELVELFDNLLLLSKGYQIYFGPINEANEYFTHMGFKKNELKSFPDWYQEMTGDPSIFYYPELDKRYAKQTREELGYDSEPGTWRDLAECWKKSDLKEKLGLTLWNEFSPQIAPPAQKGRERPAIRSSPQTQIQVLVWRQFNTIRRNFQFSVARIVQAVASGCLLGLSFWQLEHTWDDMLSKFSIMFLVCCISLFMQIPSIPLFCDLRAVHVFQTTSHYYYRPLFYMSFLIVDTLYTIPESFIQSLVLYSMVDFRDEPVISQYFLFYWLCIYVSHVTNRGMVLYATCLMGSSESAHAAMPAIFQICILTAGYLVTESNLKNIWKLVYWLNHVHYLWKALCINEFWGSEYDFEGKTLDGNAVLGIYELDVDSEDDKWAEFFILLLLCGIHNFGAILATSYLTDEVFVPSKMLTEMRTHDSRKDAEENQDEAGDKPISFQNSDRVDGQLLRDKQFEKLVPRILLTWQKLNYTVTYRSMDTGQMVDKQILDGVFGYTKPGKMIALMGASGAGKSTLMDVLADYKTGGVIEGDVLVNGHPKNEFFRFVVGYCEQFDSHEDTMTVRECIEFSAKMRLPITVPADELQDRVDSVLYKLDLEAIKDEVLGNDIEGGISPEYRKKVTIGVELVMDPGLLFLDEPTTGLDSASAYNVMHCVKRLASEMSVVCTIHQPSKEVYEVFDYMMLLKPGGRVCYFGDVNEMCQYFEDVKLGEWDGVQNKADFALDCSYAKREGIDSADLFLGHKRYQVEMEELKKLNVGLEEPKVDMKTKPGFWFKFWLLYERNYRRSYVRKLDETLTKMFMIFAIGLMLGWCFYDIPNDQTGTISRLAICFMSVSLTGFSAQSSIPILFGQRNYIFRERKAGMYTMLPWVMARWAIELPVMIVESLLITFTIHFMVGLEGDYFKFAIAWFSGYYVNSAVIDYGAQLASTQELADGFCTLVNSVNLIYAGFFIPYDSIPVYFEWCYWISTLHYAFGAIALNEFENIGDIEQDSDGVNSFKTGDDVIDKYNLGEFTWEEYLMIIWCFVLFYKLVYYLCCEYIEHIKR